MGIPASSSSSSESQWWEPQLQPWTHPVEMQWVVVAVTVEVEVQP